MKWIANEPIVAPGGIPVQIQEGKTAEGLPIFVDLDPSLALGLLTAQNGIPVDDMEDAKHLFRLAEMVANLNGKPGPIGLEDADYEWLMPKLKAHAPRVFGLHAYMLHEIFAAALDSEPTVAEDTSAE